MTLRRVAIILCVTLLLSACSTRFLYNQLDRFIAWRVGSFVTLTNEQEENFRADVREHLEKLRVNQLPSLAEEIRQIADDLAANQVPEQKIESTYQRMLALTDEFLLGVVPLSADLLMTLDAEQQQEIAENLTEINDEMFEKYSGSTSEERRENRNKSAVKSIQSFTGRLDKAQKQLVEGALARMADASEEWIAYQRDWQLRFLALLDKDLPKAEFETQLAELFLYPRDHHSEEYRQRVDSNRLILNRMLAELIDGLTDRQRGKAVDKINDYAERLAMLANSR